MLKFFCATARKPFGCGIIMDAETYARQRLDIVTVQCPHCDRRHRFLVADAELVPQRGQSDRSGDKLVLAAELKG